MKRKVVAGLLAAAMLVSVLSPVGTVVRAEESVQMEETVQSEEVVQIEEPVVVSEETGNTTEETAFSYTELEDGTIEITDYTGNETVLIIPDTINGKVVTSIGEEAFSYCSSLKAIIIPEEVVSIGSRAFANCTLSLRFVLIPKKVVNIGDNIIDGSLFVMLHGYSDSYAQTYAEENNLFFMVLDGEEKNIETSEESVYSYTELENGTIRITGYTGEDRILVIPDKIDGKKVTEIGSNISADPSSLSYIAIPKEVVSIESFAFYGCMNLKLVLIPENVESIGYGAFESNCSEVANICGYTGSYAQTYAEENSMPFIALGGKVENIEKPEDIEVPEESEKPEDTETEDSEVEDTETEDSEVEDTETEDSEVEDTETEDSKVEDTETEDSEVEDTETEDSEVEDTETEDSEVEDTETEGSEVEDTEAKDSEDENTETEDSKVEDTQKPEEDKNDININLPNKDEIENTQKPQEKPEEPSDTNELQKPQEKPENTEKPQNKPQQPNDHKNSELVLEDGKLVSYTDGVRDKDVNSFLDYGGVKYLVINGEVATDKNGLARDPQNPREWYLCTNGEVQNYTGTAEYDGAVFCVEDGKVDTQKSGYVTNNEGTFYVGAGRVMTEVNGLALDPVTREWLLVNSGKVDRETEGYVSYDTGLFYVRNGKIMTEINGFLHDTVKNVRYYLAKGQVQTHYTGLVLYDNTWFYVVKGVLASDYTGNVTYDGEVFYVKNGMLK